MLKVRKTTGVLIISLIFSTNNFTHLCWWLKHWTDYADTLLSVSDCCSRRIWRLVLCILSTLRPISHLQLPKMRVDWCLLHILHFVAGLQIWSQGRISTTLLLLWADIHHVVFLLSHTNLCMKTWGIMRDSWIYGYLWLLQRGKSSSTMWNIYEWRLERIQRLNLQIVGTQ